MLAVIADARLGVGEDRAQQEAAVAVDELVLAHAPELFLGDRQVRGVPPRGADQLRRQGLPHIRVVPDQLAGLLEHGNRLGISVCPLQCPAELERDACGALRILEHAERLAQMIDRGVVVDEALGEPERAKHLAPVGRWGRLVQRAAQKANGDVAGAPLQGAICRTPERLDDEGIAAGQRLLEVDRHLFRLGACIGEDVRGATMAGDPLRRRHFLIDRGADDRVRELERHLDAQHVGARQRCGRVRSNIGFEPCKRGDVVQLGAAAEDRERARQHGGLRGQA